MKTQEYLNQGYDEVLDANNLPQNYTYANTAQYIKEGVDVFLVKEFMVGEEVRKIKQFGEQDCYTYDDCWSHETKTPKQIMHDRAIELVNEKLESNGIQKVFSAIESNGVNVGEDIYMSVFVSAVATGNLQCAENVFKQHPKMLEDLSVSTGIIDMCLENYAYESRIDQSFIRSTQEQKLACLDFCLDNSLYQNHGRRDVMRKACEIGDKSLYEVGAKDRPILLFKDMEKQQFDLSKEGSFDIVLDLVKRGADPISFIENPINLTNGVHQKTIDEILKQKDGVISKEHAQLLLDQTLNNFVNPRLDNSQYNFENTSSLCTKNGADFNQYDYNNVFQHFDSYQQSEAKEFLTSLAHQGVKFINNSSEQFYDYNAWKKEILNDCQHISDAKEQKKTLNDELAKTFQQKQFPRNPMHGGTSIPAKKNTDQSQERGHRRM